MQATKEKTNILIVDDHELTCMGLSMMLKEKEDLAVAGIARFGQEGIDAAVRCHPDIVLMDIMLPDMDGIRATQVLKSYLPNCKVIILTAKATPEFAHAAISANVSAFCHKDISTENLYNLIRLVRQGGFWLDPSVSADIMQGGYFSPETVSEPACHRSRQAAAGPRKPEFTKREQEILKLVMAGKSNKEIAETLFITIYTVKAHLNHIYKKLGVSDRTQVPGKVLQEEAY